MVTTAVQLNLIGIRSLISFQKSYIMNKPQIFFATGLLSLTVSSLGASVQANEAPFSIVEIAQSRSPAATYANVRDGGIEFEIIDGNYRFYDILQPSENGYTGQDGNSAVLFIPSTGSVSVYSTETGESFYEYYTTPVDFDGASSSMSVARSSTPTTYMTAQGPNEIIVQITDGNFYFRDTMYRSYGNTYQATDHGYRVNYDNDSGRVTVISDETGAEVYNYFFTGTVGGSSGSSGNTSGGNYEAVPSESSLTQVNNNEYQAELSEGQFYFNGPLYRSSGDVFVGTDGRFRVVYNRGSNQVVVINLTTGEEIFNYFYSEVDEGYL